MNPLLEAYEPLLIYLTLALAVPVVLSLLAGAIGRRAPTAMKNEPYESGYPTAPLQGRFPVHFYLVAMLFVIFDVEAASFYPWAVLLRQLGVFGLAEMATFVIVLAVGYAYVWKRGGFQWR